MVDFVEREIYITEDGLGRAAIVELRTGRFRIYTHWKWNAETKKLMNVVDTVPDTWFEHKPPINMLYSGIDPLPNSYSSLEDARSAVHQLPHFASAVRLDN